MLSAPTPSTAARKVMFIAPISASTAQTSLGIPIAGFTWLDLTLLVGTMAANATIDVTVEESDTLGSGYTPIAGAVFPQKVASSHAGKPYSAEIDLRKRSKKYLRVVATCAVAASLVAVEGILTGPDRTERINGAQLASSAPATPIAAEGAAGDREFSV